MEIDEIGKKGMDRIHKAEDEYAHKVFGDDYGKERPELSAYFDRGEDEIRNNADIPSGLFSIGNQKLADKQTLIINFTSALGCPSMNFCPITQKACYAIAGENRLYRTKRKNLIVQNLVKTAMLRDKIGEDGKSNNMLQGLFDIAELYIQEANKGKKKIKYIRYNEAGDFPNQKMLVKAAEFSKKVRDEYGVMSMAYTANKNIDPSQEIDGEPIDTIIAINRSRNDIKHSSQSPDRNFYGIPMKDFSSNPDINLEHAYCDVEYVSDAKAQRLQVKAPIVGKYGIPSVPQLSYGSWDGGSGWYYVCPCSFWRYNKDKAIKKFLVDKGLVGEDFEVPEEPHRRSNMRKELLTPEENKQLDKILNKIISPCGTKCAVCHDTEGGITPDGEKVKDYSVLTATHGAGASNYDKEYAERKRQGDDSVVYKDETNPTGLDKRVIGRRQIAKDKANGVEVPDKLSYANRYAMSDAPINNNLFKRSADNAVEKEKQKEQFQEQYKRLFGTVL